MSKARLRRTQGDTPYEPFSAALAHELAQGTSREELIDRLVADGWSAGNASHFLNYVEAASTLASCLYAPEQEERRLEEPQDESRVPWLDTSGGGGGFFGGFVRGLGGLLHTTSPSSVPRGRRPGGGARPRTAR